MSLVRTFTAGTHAITITDEFILCDATAGEVSLLLPPVDAEASFHILRLDSTSNEVSINGGVPLINEVSVLLLRGKYEYVHVVPGGDTWYGFSGSLTEGPLLTVVDDVAATRVYRLTLTWNANVTPKRPMMKLVEVT